MASKRLIYKDEFGETHTTDEKINGKFVGDRAVREKLFEYEQEESEGKLIHLPCKIGDTVYCIKAMFSFLPVPKAEKIQKIELYDINIILRTVNRAFNDKDIGKTVFLTREAAEKALNSLENPNSRKEKTNG